MTIGRFGTKYLLALAIAAAALASGSTAQAHEEGEGEHGGGKGEGHGEGGEHKKHHDEHHVGTGSVDFVLGFGKVPLAIQNPAPSTGVLPTYSRGSSQITSESFVLGTAFHLLPHTAFGILLPMTFGQFHPNGNNTRGTGALGNIELEAEYERHMNHDMELFFVLGFSLPTAQGEEIPEDIDTRNNSQVDQSSYDKGSLQRAAAYSRGGEVNAFYEPKRFGINPKIGLNYKMGALTITPYLKVENLIATSSTLAHGYLGELVPSVRVGYRVGHFEPALKLWAPIAFAGSDDDKKVGFVVEPQVVMHHGHIRPVLGVIIPVAGPAADPTNIGVRLAVAASF